MARYALVKDGIVQNVIVADDGVIPHLQVDADEAVKLKASEKEIGFGDTFDGQTFTKKLAEIKPEVESPPTVEERIASLEGELAALKAGVK